MINLRIGYLEKQKRADPIKIFNNFKNKLAKVIKIIEHNKKGTAFTDIWKLNIRQVNESYATKILEEAKIIENTNVKNILLIGSKKIISNVKNMIHTLKSFTNQEINFYYASSLNEQVIGKLTKKLDSIDNFIILVLTANQNEVETKINLANAFNILEQKIGTDRANQQVTLIGKTKNLYLNDLTNQKGWNFINVGESIENKFLMTTAIGLLPLAISGIDLKEFLKGIASANITFDNLNILQNYGLQYALIRKFWTQANRSELISVYNDELFPFANLLKNLFNDYQSEKKLTYTANNCFVMTNLYSYDNYFANHATSFFETIIIVKNSNSKTVIKNPFENQKDYKLFDTAKAIEKVTMNQHLLNFGIENVEVEIEKINERTIGYLYAWFMNSYVINSLLNKINPFKESLNEKYWLAINTEIGKIMQTPFAKTDRIEIGKLNPPVQPEINQKQEVESNLIANKNLLIDNLLNEDDEDEQEDNHEINDLHHHEESGQSIEAMQEQESNETIVDDLDDTNDEDESEDEIYDSKTTEESEES